MRRRTDASTKPVQCSQRLWSCRRSASHRSAARVWPSVSPRWCLPRLVSDSRSGACVPGFRRVRARALYPFLWPTPPTALPHRRGVQTDRTRRSCRSGSTARHADGGAADTAQTASLACSGQCRDRSAAGRRALNHMALAPAPTPPHCSDCGTHVPSADRVVTDVAPGRNDSVAVVRCKWTAQLVTASREQHFARSCAPHRSNDDARRQRVETSAASRMMDGVKTARRD